MTALDRLGSPTRPYGSVWCGKTSCGDPVRCVCDAVNCEACKHKMIFGDLHYCGHFPPRCGVHQCIKGARIDGKRGCILCKHYHRNISTDRCSECLATEELVNFVVDDSVKEWIEELE